MVYENYMALALVHPSPKTRTYTVQNRLFVPSNSTAQRYRECKIHLCTLRTHFPSLHHAYKLLMQEKFTQENNNKCNQRINHISLHTHILYTIPALSYPNQYIRKKSQLITRPVIRYGFCPRGSSNTNKTHADTPS